tara:strand:+ start:370 stop:1767 length:1398 start_codon:yes stop_codon:yes gene_type:complete
MTVTLYPDQGDIVGRVCDAMRRHRNILLQSATGSGKTRMAAHMIKRASDKGNAVGFMVPRRELLKQTSATLDAFNIPHGFCAAGYVRNPFLNVHLMTSGTVAKRLDTAPKLKLLFIDECHFGGAELDKIITHYKAQGTWIIGLSATPMKTSGQGMGDWYDVMVEGPSVAWLIDNERLSKFRLYAPNTPDLSVVKSTAKGYVQRDLDAFMMADDHGKVLIGNAAKHYKEKAYGKLNLSFCTSVKAAELSSQMFNDAGVPSAVLHGKMDDAEIKKVIMAYARREILNISNCALLCFGFDLSQASGMDVTIESMSDLAPTKSLPWQMQKWGRVLRMKPEPALIFDHVGNHTQHEGGPDADRVWSLDGREKKKGNSEPTQPARQCPECFMVDRPKPECGGCGFVFPVQSRTIEEVEGELQEVTGRTITPRQQQGMAKTLDDLITHGKAKGYKNPHAWAAKIMTARMAKR